MNTKIIISIAIMTAITGNIAIGREYSESEKEEIRRLGLEERARREEEDRNYLMRRAQGLPHDPNETPTSPKTIYHDKEGQPTNVLKGGPYKIEKARIWFDTDESGKPIYRSIAEHFEKNPKFKQVGLILYHPAGWFSEESFEHIGTVADEAALTQLKDTISDYEGYLWWKRKKNGAWCPLGNVFIGGTGEIGKPNANGKKTRNMCEVYAQFLAAREQASAKK